MSEVPPLHREVLVDADPDIAFRIFTDRIGRWWPLAELSIHGAGSTVSFDDGQIVEIGANGRRAVWGTVTEWQPGRRVAFTWHPGRGTGRASRVTVSFTASDAQTLVRLVHDGWEVFADPVAARAEYDDGWPTVLGNFAAGVTRFAEAESVPEKDAATWVALLHRPGPGAPSDGSLFSAPGFADHIAFLTRMREAGWLVAAGPLTDALGEGMTVLRLPIADGFDEAHRLATQDDASVVSGFFTVEVRPWQVMLEGAS